MSAVLSRRGGLVAVLTALAMAFFLALAVYTSQAQAAEKGLCHIPPGHPENAHFIGANDPSFPAHEAHGDPVLTQEECENLPPTDTTGTSTTGFITGTSTTTTGTGNNTTVNVNTTANTTSNSVTQVTSGNQACVQTAVQQEVNKTQINQYGDNINIQNISQECNINVAEVKTILNEIGVTEVATASASAAATAGASATS